VSRERLARRQQQQRQQQVRRSLLVWMPNVLIQVWLWKPGSSKTSVKVQKESVGTLGTPRNAAAACTTKDPAKGG